MNHLPAAGRWQAYDYEKPDMQQLQVAAVRQHGQQQCTLQQAWARTPVALGRQETQRLIDEIVEKLRQHNAVMVAHYYVAPEVQDLALASGGMVGDSLEMARFGQAHEAQTLLVAGVRFMGETAKILSPSKKVLMPDMEATCSLDLGCPADEFSSFCAAHPDREVVVYANTSAEVKACADWVVTSSIALELVTFLHQQGKKIIWGPDRHLGRYIQAQTGADMVLWSGSCLVHNEFQGRELLLLKQRHPQAKVLVHPESPADVVLQADVVGSTSQLLAAVERDKADTFIVATDQGIVHEMRKRAPHKHFLPAPTAGHGANCKSCAFCPWMAMNGLRACAHALCANQSLHIVTLPAHLQQQARRPIERMLHFAAAYREFCPAAVTLPERIRYFTAWARQDERHAEYLF